MYTDVVYRVTGTFAISGTLGGLGNQSFSGLTSNASTPAFAGTGNSTPFSRPPPSGGTTFTNGFLRLRYTNNAAGCATGYNGWGNVTCNSNCGLVPAAGKGDSFQTWNQQLETVMLSGTDLRTATVTMGAMQIPNGTGQSQTRLSITSSTVLTTQCGSTPGVDLVCNVQ